MGNGWGQAEQLKQRAEGFFFALCALVLALSCVMFLGLTIAKNSIFSEIDPAAFVIPFLCYTFAMMAACLALVFLPMYMNARASYFLGSTASTAPAGRLPALVRLWLYPAAAFATLSVILFLTATFAVAYLIIL